MNTGASVAGRHVLFVGNDAGYFFSHRLALAVALAQEGFRVGVALPAPVDQGLLQRIEAAGVEVYAYPFVRGGMNVLAELQSVIGLARLYLRLKPSVVHHLTVKPILYGGMVGRLVGVPARIHAVLGLGYLFFASDIRARLLRWCLFPVFRWAMGGKGSQIIVQNSDDLSVLRKRWMVGRAGYEAAVLIRGSGVEPCKFSGDASTFEPPVILFAGRLTYAKGVHDFVLAARAFQQGADLDARFVVCGGVDTCNPGHVSEQQMRSWVDAGAIEWWGYRDDMNEVLAKATVVVLPSLYGEGVPKILIEAAAAGRAIVTTDTPGCRDIVLDGVNGFLVPPGDPNKLANAVRELLDDAALRVKMGAAGRRRVEEEFALEHVIRRTRQLYAEMLRRS